MHIFNRAPKGQGVRKKDRWKNTFASPEQPLHSVRKYLPSLTELLHSPEELLRLQGPERGPELLFVLYTWFP